MRYSLILIILIFSVQVRAAFAQNNASYSSLLRDIVHGHQLLTQYVDCLSGKIECFNNLSDTNKTDSTPVRQFLFFRDNTLIRLEYIHPIKNTDILPGHEKNDITEVLLKTMNSAFRYNAISTTGVPYANLFRLKGTDDSLELTLKTDFYSNINALTALPGCAVIDLLQDQIKSMEHRRYDNVSNALWITSADRETKNGDISHWTVVLNPNQHYAVLFHEATVKSVKTGNVIVASGKVASQVVDGKVLPQEIVLEGQMQARKTSERYIVVVFSTVKPDGKLFTEESFKELGRDYAIVDVLPNQTQVGGNVVNAAPVEARMPEYLFQKNPRLAWPWSRIFLMSTGVVLIIIACVRIYLQRKHAR